jgi:FkbM family methyltransferase
MTVYTSWDGLKWFQNTRGIIPREKNLLRTLQALATKDTVFVDIGAHVGFYTVRLAKTCRHVHAVEPNPESIKILEQNLRLNGISNVTVHPYAVGATPSASTLYMADTNTTLYPRHGVKTATVQVKTLDTLIEECHLVKIDIEGYEEQALQGAKRLITHVKPIWAIEHHDQGLGLQYYPETIGASIRIRSMLKEYYKITFDEGRSIYIHRAKLDEVPEHALRRLITLAVANKILTNIHMQRPWYHGLPYTWWYGMSALDTIEEVYERALEEQEWLKISE